MAKTKLRLINNSNDANNSQVVIFQKIITEETEEHSIACHVVNNLRPGDSCKIEYWREYKVGCSDFQGNLTPTLKVIPGQRYCMVQDSSGNILEQNGKSCKATEIEIVNKLLRETISAIIYNWMGNMLFVKTGISPGLKATFEFKTPLYIGVLEDQIVEGQKMDSGIISSITTELSLEGIASADIVMTNKGPSSFDFRLENSI